MIRFQFATEFALYQNFIIILIGSINISKLLFLCVRTFPAVAMFVQRQENMHHEEEEGRCLSPLPKKGKHAASPVVSMKICYSNVRYAKL
jgi:hypothetical protein